MNLDQIVSELGQMGVDVRHEIGGVEKKEPEDLRGAVEHATAYPCMIEMDPGRLLENLKHRVKLIVEKAEAAAHTRVVGEVRGVLTEEEKPHEFRGRPDRYCEVCHKPDRAEIHKLWRDVHEPVHLPRKPRCETLEGEEKAEFDRKYPHPSEFVRGVDVGAEPDHLVVQISCPCGARAHVSSRRPEDLDFIGDWAKAHQAHGKEVGH